MAHTLHSFVCYKNILIIGGVGGARAGSPTSNKLGTFLLRPLALGTPIYSNFKINGAGGETLKPTDPIFLRKNRGS